MRALPVINKKRVTAAPHILLRFTLVLLNVLGFR